MATATQSTSQNPQMSSDNEIPFIKPRYPFRQKKFKAQSDFKLHNGYESLCEIESDTSMESEKSDLRRKRKKNLSPPPPANASSKTGKENQPKPIIVKSTNAMIQQKLSTLKLGQKPNCKILRGGQVKISAKRTEDKIIIVNSLKAAEIEHFTFTEIENRHKLFVVKGFDNIQSEIILKTLNEDNIPASKVHPLYRKDDSATFLVSFEKGKINLATLKSQHQIVNHLQVTWETYNNKKKRTTQCRNCQRWGHSSLNCGFKTRCVKCLESHQVGQCTRKDNTEPLEKLFCVNCKKSGHPANSTTCEVYKEFSLKIEGQKKKSIQHPRPFKSTPAPWSPSTYTEEFPSIQNDPSQSTSLGQKNQNQIDQRNSQGESYRPVLNNPKINVRPSTLTEDSFGQFTSLNNEFSSIPGIKEALKIYSGLIKKLKSLSDPNAQARVLLDFAMGQV